MYRKRECWKSQRDISLSEFKQHWLSLVVPMKITLQTTQRLLLLLLLPIIPSPFLLAAIIGFFALAQVNSHICFECNRDLAEGAMATGDVVFVYDTRAAAKSPGFFFLLPANICWNCGLSVTVASHLSSWNCYSEVSNEWVCLISNTFL